MDDLPSAPELGLPRDMAVPSTLPIERLPTPRRADDHGNGTPDRRTGTHGRSSYFCLVLYPRLTTFAAPVRPDGVVEVPVEPGTAPPDPEDLTAVARFSRTYRLTRFQGQDLGIPYICRIQHGPWIATVVRHFGERPRGPDRWTLHVRDPEVHQSWEGKSFHDRPEHPLLQVVSGSLCPGRG